MRSFAAVLLAVSAGADRAQEFATLLQPIAETVSAQYNCSVVIALKTQSETASVAAGISDFSTMRPQQPDDVMVFGSLTKVLTGASVMQLAGEGRVDIDAPASRYVDPFLADSQAASGGKQSFASMAELWGPNASKVTVRQLLGMHSGIPDFDTANPCGSHSPKPCVPKDSLRATLYADPGHNFGPLELMALPWVATNQTIIPPWTYAGTAYSSTNFMLLGMILAGSQGWSTWDALMQAEFLPKKVRGLYRRLVFGAHGSPADYTPVHGYDRTAYNNNTGSRDTHAVAGTFSGWSASDIMGTAGDMAQLAWDVYGPEYNVAPKEFVDQMIPIWPWYGLATFNLTRRTGREGTLGRAYGHLGATYGYQSIVSYHPELKLSFAIATNLETDFQQHPAHGLCLSFTAIANAVLHQSATCSYTPGGYYSGGCQCNVTAA